MKTATDPRSRYAKLRGRMRQKRLSQSDADAALGFPVIVIGSRVKIPKRPFIQFMTQLKGDEEV